MGICLFGSVDIQIIITVKKFIEKVCIGKSLFQKRILGNMFVKYIFLFLYIFE